MDLYSIIETIIYFLGMWSIICIFSCIIIFFYGFLQICKRFDNNKINKPSLDKYD